jgi:hypothetical protein
LLPVGWQQTRKRFPKAVARTADGKPNHKFYKATTRDEAMIAKAIERHKEAKRNGQGFL